MYDGIRLSFNGRMRVWVRGFRRRDCDPVMLRYLSAHPVDGLMLPISRSRLAGGISFVGGAAVRLSAVLAGGISAMEAQRILGHGLALNRRLAELGMPISPLEWAPERCFYQRDGRRLQWIYYPSKRFKAKGERNAWCMAVLDAVRSDVGRARDGLESFRSLLKARPHSEDEALISALSDESGSNDRTVLIGTGKASSGDAL